MSKKIISKCITHLKIIEKNLNKEDVIPEKISECLRILEEWCIPEVNHDDRLTQELLYQDHLFTPKIIKESAECVYDTLGWGYQEAIYREALITELRSRKFICQSEVPQAIHYKDTPLSYGNSRIDILVHNDIVLELKADGVTSNTIIKANQQCSRYLSQGKYSMGIVIGFPDKPNEKVFFQIV